MSPTVPKMVAAPIGPIPRMSHRLVPEAATAVAETDGSLSFANVHDLVAGIDGAPVLTPYNWSPDSAWFTYSRRDTATGLYQVRVVDVSTGAEFDVSPDPGQAEWGAAFSPVLNDDGTLEVAFFRGETAASPLHYIYAAAFDPANPGNALTRIRQVTSKKTANLAQARNITWSPDAQHLGFQATGLGLADDVEIYVVKSDGKGKAKLVTGDGFPDGNAGIATWRTDPALD